MGLTRSGVINTGRLPFPGLEDNEGPLMGLLLDYGHQTQREFDQVAVKDAVHVAEREVPGDLPERHWEVLAAAAERLGLRVARRQASLAEALDEALERDPIVLFDRDGSWLLVGQRAGAKLHVRMPDMAADAEICPDEWLSEDELARRVGVSSLLEEVDLALVHASLPGAEAASEEPKTKPLSPFRRLVGLFRPEWPDLRLVILFSLASGVLGLAAPVAVEALVNTVAFGGLMQPVVVLALVLMVCLGLAAGFVAIEYYVVELLQRRLFARATADLAYRLPRVKVSTFDHYHGPELVNRFFDVVTIQKVGAKLLFDGLAVILTASIGMTVLAFYHPYLLAFDVVLVILVLGIAFGLGRGGVTTSLAESNAKYAVADWLEELTRHPEAFRLGGARELARDQADLLTGNWLHARARHYRIVFRQIVAALTVQVLASTLLLGLGGFLVETGELTLGQLVASWVIVSMVLGAIAKFGSQLESWYDILTSVDKVGKLLDLPLEGRGGEAHEPPLRPAGFELSKLVAGYGTGPAIVRGLDAEVLPGEKVALLGRSGSGKSLLCDVLAGLRTPASGAVKLDGIDLRHISLASLRAEVALARGDQVVAGSVAENIRLGRHSLRLSDVQEALEAVELWDAVQSLPRGLETELTSDGRPLSKGEVQRLLLARLIARQPRLLLVDGLLDGLDRGIRERIAARLCASDAPWTLVIVTQCDDVVASCSRQLELERK